MHLHRRRGSCAIASDIPIAFQTSGYFTFQRVKKAPAGQRSRIIAPSNGESASLSNQRREAVIGRAKYSVPLSLTDDLMLGRGERVPGARARCVRSGEVVARRRIPIWQLGPTIVCRGCFESQHTGCILPIGSLNIFCRQLSRCSSQQ